MNKDQQIAWQVAFKGAIELVCAGVAEPETADIAPEIAALADLLYAEAQTRLGGESSDSGKASGRAPSRKPSRTSTRSSSGRSSGGGKFKYASERQADLIVKLLDEKDHGMEVGDSSFEYNGDTVEFDEIPSGITQDIIGYLLSCDDI